MSTYTPPQRLRIGIFFGGQSREREVAFAGGRTVYDNLDRTLFVPIPVFIDSIGNFILLHWRYLYQGTIRDFYPPIAQDMQSAFQLYIESLQLDPQAIDVMIQKVGKKVTPDQFSTLFDFAFLALHGIYGEDGRVQGLLEWYQIPYSGSGLLGAALGMDKAVQGHWIQHTGFSMPNRKIIKRFDWEKTKDKQALLDQVIAKIGLPFIVKSARQGSSIGVSIIQKNCLYTFIQAIEKSFFIHTITPNIWRLWTSQVKKVWITSLMDLREGIGLPIIVHDQIIAHPAKLLEYINDYCIKQDALLTLQSVETEDTIICETYINGREFSCIVITDENKQPIALPPTEIIKTASYFDYRSKYLPGIVRKQTPMTVSLKHIQQINETCCRLFTALSCQVYARIDGLLTDDGTCYLIDPNITAGMLPASFLFHQAAMIGLNPSDFFTFIIHRSLKERMVNYQHTYKLQEMMAVLDNYMTSEKKKDNTIRIGVLMGGFSEERHIALESGKNIYQKLTASKKYTPIPLWLTGSPDQHRLFILPLYMMVKDHADDIHHILLKEDLLFMPNSIKNIQKETKCITKKYAKNRQFQPKEICYKTLKTYIDTVFIALHGRPGEDGTIQKILEEQSIPYNGSGVQTSKITIDKFATNQLLYSHGIYVAEQMLLDKAMWLNHQKAAIQQIEQKFTYPFIMKPVDEGCSEAVVKIKHRQALMAYAAAVLSNDPVSSSLYTAILELAPNTILSKKKHVLIESFIQQGDAQHFLEITGGLLTHTDKHGQLIYEIFTPSETLAIDDILSLEEKFLAGEGQNITPARFAKTSSLNTAITKKVQQDLKKTAEILQIEGYARIDAFVKIYEHKIETWIIEVNTLPAMTPSTCIFHQCALHGYQPYDFIDTIIQNGIQKYNQKNVK